MKHCNSCKIAFDDEATYCTKCGEPLEIVSSDENKSSRNHKGAIAIAITAIAAVAAVAIVAIIFLGSRNDGVPVALAVSFSGQEGGSSAPMIVHFEGTTKDGTNESRDLVFGEGKQPRIPEGTYKACPVASPIFDDGSIYAVPEAVEITVSTDTQADQQQKQPAIEFSSRLAGVEITDDMIDASLKMMSEAGCAKERTSELKTAATELRAAGIPGNTSGNIVNGGRVVETESGAYYAENELLDTQADQGMPGMRGRIFNTKDGKSSEQLYDQDGSINCLNHCGDRFYFFEWMPGDPISRSSLISISDNLDLSTRQSHCSSVYMPRSLNATTKQAYFIEALDESNNSADVITHLDYSTGEASKIYSAEMLDSLNLYGSHLYFVAASSGTRGGSAQIVRTDTNGGNATVLYSTNTSVESLNVGPEGLTFAEFDTAKQTSTLRRLQLDGQDTGMNVGLSHRSVGGLNVSGGWLYALTAEHYANRPPGLEYLEVYDLRTGDSNSQKLDRGGNSRFLCTALGHAFYEAGYAADDEKIPPVPLPDPANMAPRENADNSYHVVTPDYEFDIPEYWRGKVEYETDTNSSGMLHTTIYLAGASPDSDYYLASVSCVPASRYTEEDGDIGGHRVLTVKSDTKYVEVWTKNWPFYAWLKASGNDSVSQRLNQTYVEKLVDLSTGGAISYEQAIQSENSGLNEEVSFNRNAFEQTLRVVN